MSKEDFDLEIWAKKGLKKIGIACGISACNTTYNYFNETLVEVPTEYIFALTIGMAVIELIGNWLKHKK